MENLKINTDAAVAAADAIQRLNDRNRNDFEEVQTAIAKLDVVWDGQAAAYTMDKFNELKAKFPEAQYRVIDNYVQFLLQQVGEGYVQTEKANESLADAFK